MTVLDPAAGLAALASPDPAVLERLHARLEDGAAHAGALDIAYTVTGTPVGRLLLAATGQGLVRVAFEGEGHDAVLASLAGSISPRILRSPQRLAGAVRQLEEYFAGARRASELPLDRRLPSGFRLSVLEHLPLVSYGRTESYAQVAAAVGSPKAVRAVGTACATNPLPIVVPCHRVLRSDGTYGGYLGGSDAKAYLLGLEAA
ncbi:methylated-DNA--[protein]-cysteine S-methyltransferase [Arthrobacter deserti]|uniref:Methylated-DNA--protein-cysteine methyltransferase n=1 Tax=Arthrobacter deserti TaxID=1742687 RepID=A0ABX1JPA8_9MICC|nr:methylated-DNA--[protein]-cysteine S-methyltransferase [Arthrobacter deserti]